MAIVQPTFISFTYGQAGSWTVTLSPAESVSGWTVSCVVRAYNGGAALITKTSATPSEITVTDSSNGVFVVYFSETDLSLTYGPGAYVIQLMRTNSGASYPITDASTLLLMPAASTASPRLTNVGEYLAYTNKSMTVSDADAFQYLLTLADAEEFLQQICNRTFTYSASQTVYLDGNGEQRVTCPRTPIQSIITLCVDPNGNYGKTTGAFDSSLNLTEGDGYVLKYDDPFNPTYSRSGIIERIGTVWPISRFRPRDSLSFMPEPCRGCIKLVGNFGYMIVPTPIKRAVWDMATLARQSALHGGRMFTSQSGEGYSRSFGGLEDDAKRINSVSKIVAAYKRYVV